MPNPFYTPQDNLPPGADDRNNRPSKEPSDYLTPREDEISNSFINHRG